MAKYPDVVARIKALIRKRGLGPGDPLPSERDLSRQFKVAYGTVRMANDYLIRTGVIERQQGRGTFVAASTETEAARPESGEPATAPDAAAASMGGTARRLGLLSVEMGLYESPYLRALTFAVQRLAQEAGYELIVEQLEIEQLVEGKLPRMVRRQSVDGLFLYGRVQAHHVRFLRQQPLPLLLIGNRPVPGLTPQVRINAEDLTYQVTQHILSLGRWPVWLDADPANVQYTAGQEMLTGYRRAVSEKDPGAPLHLCSLRLNRIDDAANQLLQAELSNAAFLVQDWSASLLMLKLATRDPQRLRQLLIVPQPFEEPGQTLRGPNVVTWEGVQGSDNLAAPAVKAMVDLIEGRSDDLQSVQLEFDVQMVRREPVPHMGCRVMPRVWSPPEQEDPSEAVHTGWM